MEDIRCYIDEDETVRTLGSDDDTLRLDRSELFGRGDDVEVPFHIPRD